MEKTLFRRLSNTCVSNSLILPWYGGGSGDIRFSKLCEVLGYWNLLETLGIFWNLTDSFGFFWILMESFGSFRILLESIRIFFEFFQQLGRPRTWAVQSFVNTFPWIYWNHLALFRISWNHLEFFGFFWILLDTFGLFWNLFGILWNLLESF